MFIKRSISKSIILSGIAALTLASAAGGAQAWDGRGYHDGYRGPSPRGHYVPAPHRGDGYGYDRDRHRDRDRDLKRGLAIGLGAAIIGGIIAAEANKSRVNQYYD